jgi:hypothetical protein
MDVPKFVPPKLVTFFLNSLQYPAQPQSQLRLAGSELIGVQEHIRAFPLEGGQ